MKWSRRDLLATAGLTAGGPGLVGRARGAGAQGGAVAACRSVPTVVRRLHLVAMEKPSS
jgi:hypothetical protein